MLDKELRKDLEKEMDRRMDTFLLELGYLMKAEMFEVDNNSLLIGSYILNAALKYNYPILPYAQIMEDMPVNELNIITNKITPETWNKINKLALTNSSYDIAEILKNKQPKNGSKYDCERLTSSIINLVSALLDTKKDEKISNFFCQNGLFLSKEFQKNPKGSYIGVDPNAEDVCVAKLRLQVVLDEMAIMNNINKNTAKVEIFNAGFMDIISEERFDKAFANFPFGMKVRSLNENVERYFLKYPFLKMGTALEWFYSCLITENLENNGKAVVLISNGCTWNRIDEQARRYFVDQGYIEAVISLPEKMLASTNIPVSLIVFSKGNRGIRFIDATKMYKAGRRFNEFTNENIEEVLRLYSSDEANSIFVSNDKVRESEYLLSPERYCSLVNEVVMGEKDILLGDIVKVGRGAPLTASQLDELDTKNESECRYLRLADIQNGEITDNLPSMTHIEKKYEKYILKKDNIILSKNGYPFKVAIVDIDDVQILPVGNLYVLEVNKELANPYYIKVFLESEKGIERLKAIITGVTIPVINVEKLKGIIVSLPDIEEQNRLVDEYLNGYSRIKKLRSELNVAIDELNKFVAEKF